MKNIIIKSIASIIVIFIMIFSIMFFGIFISEVYAGFDPIDQTYVHLTVPEIGNTPLMTANTDSESVNMVYLNKVDWIDLENHKNLTNTDVFEKGKIYRAMVWIQPKDSNLTIVDENTKVYIMGNKATWYQTSGNMVQFYYDFYLLQYYNIVFDFNGGSGTSLPIIIMEGADYELAPVYGYGIEEYPDGKLFNGWKLGEKIYQPGDIYSNVTSNLTFVAQWINGYTVGFALDGGTMNGMENFMMKEGEKIARPTDDPSKDGYRFDNWYTDLTFKTKYDFDTPITGNRIIYAKYFKQCKIKIDYNGGTNKGFKSMPLDEGTVLNKEDIENSFKTMVTPPTGKEFDYIEINGKKWTANTYTLNSDITMKILWKDKASTKVLLGDMNKNGKVEANDAYLALQLSVSGKKPTADELKRGDIDGNGKIDAFDAYQILAYSVGIKDKKYWK